MKSVIDNKLIKLNHILIQLLILAQPFIIMFQAMVVRDVQLFGVSIFEGFNIVVVCISTLLTIYTHSNKKLFVKYIPYVVVLGIYIIVHGYNIYQFNEEVYSAQSPNFFVETYYIFRTFIVPLLVLFNVYYSALKKEQIVQILINFVFVIVLVMVFSNLFGFALRNYSDVTKFNEMSIFDWFTFANPSARSYYELTTKGWFLSGNQMAAVLFMAFPVVLFITYKQRKVFHYFLVILQMLAMFMLGTKIANAGCLLVLMFFIAGWFLFRLLKQEKKGVLWFAVIFLVFVVLLPFSPIGYKYRYEMDSKKDNTGNSAALMLDRVMEVDVEEKVEENEDMREYYENLIKDSQVFKTLKADSLTNEEKEFVKKYMMDYCDYFGISPYIIEHYDDLNHSVFWVRYLQETPNNDYRVLKTMILEDIYKNNDNPLDKYVGMGYTLNYIYTETDYSFQMYSYGLIGLTLLIGPYFVMLVYVLYQGLRHFKHMFTLECAIYFSAPLFGVAIAKFSGHVLERSFPLIVMGVLLGLVLLHTRNIVNLQYGENNYERNDNY